MTRKSRAPLSATNVTVLPVAYGTPSRVPGPSTIGLAPESTSLVASASRRGAVRVGVAVHRVSSRKFPPAYVIQKTRRPDVATCEMPLPVLGPSVQMRVVPAPSRQSPRLAVSHSTTYAHRFRSRVSRTA